MLEDCTKNWDVSNDCYIIVSKNLYTILSYHTGTVLIVNADSNNLLGSEEDKEL